MCTVTGWFCALVQCSINAGPRLFLCQKYPHCVSSIFVRVIALQAVDLNQWSSNPEAFYHEFNTAAQTAETTRGSVEALFVALLKVWPSFHCITLNSLLQELFLSSSHHCIFEILVNTLIMGIWVKHAGVRLAEAGVTYSLVVWFSHIENLCIQLYLRLWRLLVLDALLEWFHHFPPKTRQSLDLCLRKRLFINLFHLLRMICSITLIFCPGSTPLYWRYQDRPIVDQVVVRDVKTWIICAYRIPKECKRTLRMINW